MEVTVEKALSDLVEAINPRSINEEVIGWKNMPDDKSVIQAVKVLEGLSGTTTVPKLSLNPDEEEVIRYLSWLNNSKFAYHIDDTPYDIVFNFEISLMDLIILQGNHMIMWWHHDSTFLWDNY